MNFLSTAASLGDMLKGADVSGVQTNILTGMAVAVPVVIGLLGIKKGFGFFLGLIKRA